MKFNNETIRTAVWEWLEEAEKAEATIKETQEESTHLKDSMYR